MRHIPSATGTEPRRRRVRVLAAFLASTLALSAAAIVDIVQVPSAEAATGSTLSTETFSGPTVPDARWIGLGDACLTAAAGGAAAPAGDSNLGGCADTVDSPAIGSGSDGYLQLTDNSSGQTGATVYDRAFPATAGLQVSFNEYQYAVSGTGLGAADGIGFFLTDGSYSLTQPGPQGDGFGGALGYATIEDQSGVQQGYLGVGLDVYGNYEAQPYVGTSCTRANGDVPQPNSVGLRGPGDGTTGYCLLGNTRYTGLQNAPATAPGGATGTPQRVTVTVSPTTATDQYPTITVQINGTTVLVEKMTTPAPPTMKLGFAASTGGGHEVHLIRQVSVTTVNSLGSISLVKTVDHSADTGTPQNVFTEGDHVPYSFLVTNTGVEALHDITVTDPKISDVSCPATTLAPADSFTCTGSYGPLTAADVASGTFTNTATVNAVNEDGDPVTDDSSVDIPTYQSAALSVTKAVTGSGAAQLDPSTSFTVDYSYPAGDYVPASTDASGQPNGYPAGSGTLTVTPGGTATTGRIPTGAVVALSEETPTAIPGTTWGTPDFSSDPVTVGATGTTAVQLDNPLSVIPAPSISLVKTADVAVVSQVGQTITYSFAVTDTGNVPLTDIGVTETAFSGTGTMPPIVCPSSSLNPGETETCTATYPATRADLEAGVITNTATSHGTPPGASAPVVSDPSSARVVGVAPAKNPEFPSIAVVKSAAPSDAAHFRLGQTITYSFAVTNTGTVALSDVNVTDEDFTGSGALSAIDCPQTALAVGAEMTCTAQYTLTQADIDRGSLDNTATAQGTPPDSPLPVNAPPSSVHLPAQQHPAVSLVKTADPTTVGRAGQSIAYSFLVTNTGDVTLHDVGVTETAFSGTGSMSALECPATALVPGASELCTASYVVTQADVDAGVITNTANSHGTPPSGGPVDSPPSSAKVTAPAQPDIATLKTASVTAVDRIGAKIGYTFTITNTGNVTLHDVAVIEQGFTGSGRLSDVSCPASASLAPAAQEQCTASYTVTAADLAAGTIANTAISRGTPLRGTTPVESEPSTATVTAKQKPTPPVTPPTPPVTTHPTHPVSPPTTPASYPTAPAKDPNPTSTPTVVPEHGSHGGHGAATPGPLTVPDGTSGGIHVDTGGHAVTGRTDWLALVELGAAAFLAGGVAISYAARRRGKR